MTIQAQNLMTSPAITVAADTPIRELAKIMSQHQISGVPVVDKTGKLVGLVTELNLISRNAPVIDPNYISLLSGLIPVDVKQYHHYRDQLRQVLASTAEGLMTKDVQCITPTTALETMLGLMEQPEIVQLPVVENDRVVGVVTRTDLVRLIEKLEMAPENPAPIEVDLH